MDRPEGDEKCYVLHIKQCLFCRQSLKKIFLDEDQAKAALEADNSDVAKETDSKEDPRPVDSDKKSDSNLKDQSKEKQQTAYSNIGIRKFLYQRIKTYKYNKYF